MQSRLSASGPVRHNPRSETGRKKWVLRLQREGKRRDRGLGSYPAVWRAETRYRAALDLMFALNLLSHYSELNTPGRRSL
jgi:hypothetical protein